MIKKLVEHGIPRTQIAAIGDADSYAKKLALFEKVRQGSIRVLIGSTQKMAAHGAEGEWTRRVSEGEERKAARG